MDLWIRSQDKEDLLKAEYIAIVDAIDEGKYDVILQDAEVVASYPSKERALEVLDEIQMFIDGEIVETRETTQLVFPRNTNVYEMPLE